MLNTNPFETQFILKLQILFCYNGFQTYNIHLKNKTSMEPGKDASHFIQSLAIICSNGGLLEVMSVSTQSELMAHPSRQGMHHKPVVVPFIVLE